MVLIEAACAIQAQASYIVLNLIDEVLESLGPAFMETSIGFIDDYNESYYCSLAIRLRRSPK